MYSDKIDKVCRLCIHSVAVKGSATHLRCGLRGGYTPISGGCADFSYDIFKKTVRRAKRFSPRRYSADDFKL